MSGDETLERMLRLLFRIDNRLAGMHELLEQRMNEGGARSSVEIVEDAKGGRHPTVKRYADSPLDGLLEDALATMAEAKLRLPLEDNIASWEATLEWARQRRQDRGDAA